MPLLYLFGVKSRNWPQRVRSCCDIHHNHRHWKPCFWTWSPYSPVRYVRLLEKLIGHTSLVLLFFILCHGMTPESRFLLMLLLYWGLWVFPYSFSMDLLQLFCKVTFSSSVFILEWWHCMFGCSINYSNFQCLVLTRWFYWITLAYYY
jgi:hypothetical protein